MATDEESLRQIAELREEITAKRSQREATRRRLHALEERAADMGRDTPPHITNEITDAIRERGRLDTVIAELGRQVARLELAPTSGLVLPPGEVLPQLAPAVIDTRLLAVERRLERQDEAIERIEQRMDEGREWRGRQDTERLDGQLGRRSRERFLIALLFLIAAGVIFIALRVS